MDFFNKISSKTQSLNRNESHLLKYILENSNEVLNMKIHDLSSKAFISTASIIRFCKKLGFNGYSEFKANLAMSLKSKDNDRANLQLDNISLIDAINKSINLINDNVIDQIIDIMHNADVIHFYGEGSSRNLCRESSRHFQLLGKNCHYFDDTSIMYASASQLSENSIVFAISMSGETQQIIKASNIAKANNAKVISLTNVGCNTLSNLSDMSLFIYSIRYNMNNFSFVSRHTASMLMEYIFFKYLKKYHEIDELK
ncbi:putative HTH-type transcriptional regulator YbbH [Alkalithermobacter paradoxus]|uniref:Putative HTH-type transcriptional regulator YbbH n=1 Tax=Alkalithermobacter paradoxus TaxID=29349 RepID=A0A1V4IB69_9FIRM|nr:putative HTH-type transcriptional regulator YbbH [[Clostridium] thermoalcaliphilum]